MKENWKDIKGYEGLYEISNIGRVRSKDRVIEKSTGYPQRLSSRWIHPYNFKSIPYVILSKESKPQPYNLRTLLKKHFTKFKIVTVTEEEPLKPGEVFVPVKGYEGYYEISNYGTIVSLGRSVKRKDSIERKVHRKKLNNRVNQICLSKDNIHYPHFFTNVFLESFCKGYNRNECKYIRTNDNSKLTDNFIVIRRLDHNPVTITSPEGEAKTFSNYLEASKEYKIPTSPETFTKFFFRDIDNQRDYLKLDGYQISFKYPAYNSGEFKIVKIITTVKFTYKKS